MAEHVVDLVIGLAPLSNNVFLYQPTKQLILSPTLTVCWYNAASLILLLLKLINTGYLFLLILVHHNDASYVIVYL